MIDVKVSVTFRHTRPTDALKRYAQRKAAKLGKYFHRPLAAHWVLCVDAKDRHLAEVTLQSGRLAIHSEEATTDLYSAIDRVMDKIEGQVRKYKTRLRSRRVMR